MKKFKSIFICGLLFSIGACTTLPSHNSNVYSQKKLYQVQLTKYGTIVNLTNGYVQSDGNFLISLVGATVGGLLGNQVGGGSGRKVATVVGALGGGYAANQVYTNQASKPVKQITFRIDGSEKLYTVLQADNSNSLYIGQRVMVMSDGNEVRIQPY